MLLAASANIAAKDSEDDVTEMNKNADTEASREQTGA